MHSTKISRVDTLMAKWSDDGASRGPAFIELRDLARELESAAAPQVVADELADEKMDTLREQTYDRNQSMKADIYTFGRACYRAALEVKKNGS
ncbi:hypothetical protein [Pseudomonas sp.]|uniref:hypothetical protein n=1 Tax=Pseudomonas sp. TaxID=306 RepID=UPI003FD83D05